MKLLLIIILALVVAAVIGSIAAAGETGQVLFALGDVSVQTSLVFFLIALIVLFSLFYATIRVLVYLLNLPAQLERRRAYKRQQLAEKYLNRGLLALVEGRWKTAEDDLIKGTRYTHTPLINYLCAARAAQSQGKISSRDHYLKLAHSEGSDDKSALALAQAELQLAQHQYELALATLTHLYEQQPRQNQVKLLLLKTCIGLRSWRDVLTLLTEIERYRLMPEENILAIQLQAYAGLMQDAGNRASKRELESLWGGMPKKLRRELYLLEVYTQEKLKFADSSDCEPLLRQALRQHRDSAIIRLYGMVAGADPARQLAFAESLHLSRARDADLLLTLGRLCIRNALWGKAATYLKECIQIEPKPEAYRELAMLLERQGDYAGASSYYQQGLTLATDSVRHDSIKLLEQAEEEKKMAAGARQVV